MEIDVIPSSLTKQMLDNEVELKKKKPAGTDFFCRIALASDYHFNI